jgi:adenosine kinase
MHPIVLTGSIAFDYILHEANPFSTYIDPKQLDNLNIGFYSPKLEKRLGGTAANLAYTMGLLSTKPIIYSTVGHDFTEYQQYLKSAGVNCSHIQIKSDQVTGCAFMIIDPQENQIGSFGSGAGLYDTQLDLTTMPSQAFYVIGPSGGGTEGTINMINQAVKLKLEYLFDPAFNIPNLPPEILKKGINHAKIIIANEYEFNLLRDRTGYTQDQLIQNNRILITTLGPRGSQIQHLTASTNGRSASSRDNRQLTTLTIPPVFPKQVVDPTGAGDNYRAGFLAGFLRDFDLQTCGQMGSLAAAYSLEHPGGTSHTFSIEEFQTRYKKTFKHKLRLST